VSIFEVAHWSGALPLALLVVLGVMGRRVPAAYWWVASSFAVSVLADSVQAVVGGTFDVTFYYAPVQIALAAAAFQSGVIDRAGTFALLAVAGWVSAHATTAPAEWMVTLAGGITICAAAWHRGLLRAPLWAYFGLGTLAYVWMVPVIGTEAILPRWFAYQACRWLAFALFAYAALRHEEDVWT
jgi:hypothetical protein